MELTIWEIFFCSHFPSFVAMQIQVWTGLPLGRNDNEDPLCSMGKRTTGSGCSGYAINSQWQSPECFYEEWLPTMRSFPIGPLWESREKSCSGQHRCAILLRQGRVCGGRHTNPSVYVWGLPPESAIGGKQLGVGFLTSLPCRAMTRTWKDDQWKGCRVHASCFQLGTRWVQGGVTYGHAAQPTTQETRSRTNELASLLHERLVLQSQGLLGISTKKMAKSNA